MKKKFLFLSLPAMVLALFLSGSGKTPDEELQAKVPDSANGLIFVDGNNVVKTKLYNDNKEKILKELKKSSLSEDVFQCRVLVFLCTREEWGGFLIQSADKQVKKIFEHSLENIKKENEKFKDVKETQVGGERHVTATVDGNRIIVIFYHDDLMLIGINKTDPALFNAKKTNPLFKEIRLQNMLLSAAIRGEMPEGKNKQSADMACQMIPALKKMETVSLNIPFSADDPVMDFRMAFQDDQAAGEMLATANMWIGFAAQGGPEFVDFTQKLNRKAEKNVFSLSFKLKDAEEFGNKVQEAQKRKEQQLKAAREQQARNRKKAQSARKKGKKAAAPAVKAQPAAPAAAPAKEAQPAAQQK